MLRFCVQSCVLFATARALRRMPRCSRAPSALARVSCLEAATGQLLSHACESHARAHMYTQDQNLSMRRPTCTLKPGCRPSPDRDECIHMHAYDVETKPVLHPLPQPWLKALYALCGSKEPWPLTCPVCHEGGRNGWCKSAGRADTSRRSRSAAGAAEDQALCRRNPAQTARETKPLRASRFPKYCILCCFVCRWKHVVLSDTRTLTGMAACRNTVTVHIEPGMPEGHPFVFKGQAEQV